MNFLAHLYLSGENPKIMAGNFMGDFVKGRASLQKLDPELVRGVELHRAIDHFTDHHPVVSQSKDRLRPTYRHYAGVIVDVLYDHYLARHWQKYHHTPLEDFAAHVYTTMQAQQHLLPPGLQQMLPYMIRGNWLVGYSHIEGIQRTLTGMSRRTSHESRMDEAVNDLRKYYKEFEHEFESFFPDLQQHARVFLAG
jgi:acyl carrier protein phosphodiesterase